jgi:putative lumazine-binding protein
MFASSAGKEEEGDLRITHVDVSGNAASVKVIETYPRSIYIDYLNLLQINNQWTIVNKIYTSHAR